jgi:peptidoglycan/xylan/chitin deacetylase (PgdA/CDA1 family)
MLTIITYHYIRDTSGTRYQGIKALPIKKFDGQLDYITKHYTVCSLAHIISAFCNKERLSHNACLLTFDDGLIDHYLTVFPRLAERGIVGSFYPSAVTVMENKILDVHKIHFILASTDKYDKLINDIFELLKPYREEYAIIEGKQLYNKFVTQFAELSKHDCPEIVFIKSFLQRGLPVKCCSEIVDKLFKYYVNDNEETLAKELYLDISQLRCMAKYGMEIGGHGYTHNWLDTLSKIEQEKEIYLTVDFLTKIYGVTPLNWAMCYPHGSYNNTTIELLKQAGCSLGLTIQHGLVSELSNPMTLNRLDTNDIPFSKHEDICEWTKKL